MSEIDYLAVNRANWDERVAIHVASDFYDVPGFKAGGDPLRDFEIEEVGDVAGKSLAHLQCHFGLDTLAWARRGAQVCGLDLSEKAVETATALAEECGLEARFVAADVYDAPVALGGAYDIVYTGIGALVWLPDMRRWAEVVAALLKPGGFLYLSEFHPFTDMLDDAEGSTVTFDYFRSDPQIWDEPYTYTGSEELANTTSVQFQHTLGEVVSALAWAGLRIDFLHEHDHTLFRRFGNLEAHGPVYRLPEGRPRIPLMFSIKASRQGSAP
ncbi:MULTISPECIES: class I SAM-dependent methyltransferase [Nonomuraea]|uniref:Class I SAM-dependent methyltransferase n=1 Tax=Nonomuraea ferruginea TaxID=46174 RepID=A0ABT4T7V6_9ACTN|nr:class I SAM-dependent methyltransferase [Nonomuraea ferruginea]MDA0645086.1 class I SAM-dependent methyltransferase [Nonomuraea ferruginea]